MGAAGLEDSLHAAATGGIEHFGRHASRDAGNGRAEHDLRTTGHAGRDGEHQHRREKGSAAAGDVEAHPLDGYGALEAADAGLRIERHRCRALRLVEGADVGRRRFDGLLYFRADGRFGLGEFRLAHFERREGDAVDLLRQGAQGFVALRPHPLQDGRDALPHDGIVVGRTGAEGGPFGLGRVDYQLHNSFCRKRGFRV